LNSRQSLKVVEEMGSKMVEQQACVGSEETVTNVASCGASGRYVPSIKVKHSTRSERANFHQGRSCPYLSLVGLMKIASSNG
jgi:hypothetical protein